MCSSGLAWEPVGCCGLLRLADFVLEGLALVAAGDLKVEISFVLEGAVGLHGGLHAGEVISVDRVDHIAVANPQLVEERAASNPREAVAIDLAIVSLVRDGPDGVCELLWVLEGLVEGVFVDDKFVLAFLLNSVPLALLFALLGLSLDECAAFHLEVLGGAIGSLEDDHSGLDSVNHGLVAQEGVADPVALGAILTASPGPQKLKIPCMTQPNLLAGWA